MWDGFGSEAKAAGSCVEFGARWFESFVLEV